MSSVNFQAMLERVVGLKTKRKSCIMCSGKGTVASGQVIGRMRIRVVI